MLLIIVKSLLIGLVTSITLGPMSFLVIQRAVNKGFRSGYFSALGVVLVDVIYAIIAIFSVSFLVDFIEEYNNEFQLVGGIIVIIIGIGINRSDPLRQVKKKVRKKRDVLKDFVSVFFLTLPNPSPYITFTAIFAATGLVTSHHMLLDKFTMLLFLFIGMSLWWGGLIYLLVKHKERIGLRQLVKINKVLSYIVIVFGVGLLCHFVYQTL